MGLSHGIPVFKLSVFAGLQRMAELEFLHAFIKTLPFFIVGLLMCFRVLTILNQSAYRCALQRYENWNDLGICMLQVRNRAKVST